MADIETDSSSKPFPWGLVVTALVVLVMILFALWAVKDKKRSQEREAVAMALDQELVKEGQAVKDQRALLDDLTRQVEELRARIAAGEVKDGKAAVEQFNKLAEKQRAARETFIQMAEAYNKKVSEFRRLQE